MRTLAPVGLFSLVIPALLALPVVTPPSTAPAPHPVRATTASLPVAGVDPVALAEAAGSPGQPFLLTGRTETEPFTTLGVTWRPGTGSAAVTVSARTRGDKGWGEWKSLDLGEDGGPDRVSSEATDPGLRAGTAPSWVGEASGVQVRVDVPSGPAPQDVRVELVDPGESSADATMGQRSSPASTATAATRQPAIISRAQWGADESIRTAAPSYASGVRVAYVHHTASSNDYTAEQAAAQVRGFYAYHVQSLGWSDIGYNFLVDRFGRVYEGRYGGIDRAVIGAHAGGFNTGSMGVSMIGTYSTVSPPAATLASVRDLLAWKLSLDGTDPLGKQVVTSGGGSTARYPAGTQVTVDVILGHRDTNATACPGDAGYSKLAALRRSVADLVATTNAVAQNPIDAKHASLGGANGFLGLPVGAEFGGPGARARAYQGGSIYWSTGTGAFEVHGAILRTWAGTGWERGVLGWPITDETITPDRVGRYNHFQSGSAYWTPSTGAHEVHGAIRNTWASHGWERGPVGYPVTSELLTRDGLGRYNHFQSGSIYWTPATGAQEVRGAIRGTWSALGGETGPLGYPLTHELATRDGIGRYSLFQNGAVYWTPGTGAKEVRGAIRLRWAELRWEQGQLGYPTSNEYDVPGGRRSDFQRGSIVWTAATGATTVL